MPVPSFAKSSEVKIMKQFLTLIECRRPIWLLSDKDYKNTVLVNNLWEEVLQNLKEEFPDGALEWYSIACVEDMKVKLTALKLTHSSKKKQAKSSNGALNVMASEWEDYLSFLDANNLVAELIDWQGLASIVDEQEDGIAIPAVVEKVVGDDFGDLTEDETGLCCFLFMCCCFDDDI